MTLLSNIPVTHPLSLFFAPIEAFNKQVKFGFGLILETTCETSRERIYLGQRQQMIEWLMKLLPPRGVSEKDTKRKSWTWTDFDLVNRMFYRKLDKTHQQRKVFTEPEIWNTIIGIHNLLGNVGQDPTAKAICTTYYGATREEVIFLIKLCEICYPNANSKCKRPLKLIISTAIF